MITRIGVKQKMNILSRKQAAQVFAYVYVFGSPAVFYRVKNQREIYPAALEDDFDYYSKLYPLYGKGSRQAFYNDFLEYSGQLRRNERPKWTSDLEKRCGIEIPMYDFYLTWEKEWKERDE